jgi:hypothetical protein
MSKEVPYIKTPAYIKSLEDDRVRLQSVEADNARWLAEITRLRETIAEKNEEIRDLSKFQLYCYKNTDYKG